MDVALWWIGAAHAALYLAVGVVFAATWSMHRILRYLGLWKVVLQGLSEMRRREWPGA